MKGQKGYIWRQIGQYSARDEDAFSSVFSSTPLQPNMHIIHLKRKTEVFS